MLVNIGNVGLSMSMTHNQLSPKLLLGSEAPLAGWVSRRFDDKVPTTTVVWATKLTGNIELTTQMVLTAGVS